MTVESLSYYQKEALALIAKNKNEPTEAEIELAKRFTDYGQIEAFRVLGTEQAELALTLSSESGNALSIICKNKDYTYRTATEDDITLAKRFTDYGQVQAFRVLGTEQVELALTLSSESGNALSIICKNKDYTYRTATEDDITLAKRFTDYGQVQAFRVLGTEQAELALTFENDASSEALGKICRNQDGSYRTATEVDIELAKQFKLDSQAEAINILEDANAALKFIYAAQVSKLKEYGKDNFEQALTDGETTVKEFDADKLIGSITQLVKQHNVAEQICKYHALFSNKESCLNNKDVLDNKELENALPESEEMDALADKLGDVTMLNNPGILTSANPDDELACTILPLMFNAICSGDLNTEL